MELSAVVALGVVAVVIAVLLRQYRPEYAVMVSIMFSILVFWAVIESLAPVTDTVKTVLSKTGNGMYIETLLKALGISFITQIASDSCKDAGESAISAKIELAGRIALVVLALPMFSEILAIAMRFMSF